MAILGQSSLGTMRLNAARLNYHNCLCYVTINGVQRRTNVRFDGFTIRSSVNSSPDTAALRVWNFTPAAMQDIKVFIGSTAPTELIFGGTIQRVTQVAEGKQANVAYDLECVDYSWLMDRRLVFKTYTAVSATFVAQDIIANVTSGYTSNNVQPGLPIVSIAYIGVPPSLALTQLAQLVGGAHWKMSYTKDLRFGTSNSSLPDPATLTASNMTMDSPFSAVTDGSQVRTRIFVIGKGTKAVAQGSISDTVLPIDDSTLFSSGSAVVGGQLVTYTGVANAYTGTVVGPGIGPATPPVPFLNSAGSSLTLGQPVQYAITFVTAAGETVAGSVITITPLLTNLPTPIESPTFVAQSGASGGLSAGANYQYKVTTSVDGGGETDPGPASAVMVPTGTSMLITFTLTLQAGTRYVSLYRTTGGGATFKLLQQFDLALYAPTIPSIGGSWGFVPSYLDSVPDGSLGAAAPGSNTASRGSVNLTGIATGGASVTQRKIYRTVANGSQLKLLHTIADNVTANYLDSLADSTLGANIPTSDTSGLSMPSGQVSAGSTTMRIAGTGAFSASGGWVVTGGQSIKYAGTDVQNLTGIPASGIGAIKSTLSYGAEITIPPMLTGIPASGPGSIAATVNIGDPVRPYNQVDDIAAQTALAAREGGDGVHEDKIEDDTLVTDAMRIAAGTAQMTLFKAVDLQNTFSARDYKLQCGATATFNVSSPTSFTGQGVIQSVLISQLNQPGTPRFLYPLRTIDTAATRLTLAEFLAKLVV